MKGGVMNMSMTVLYKKSPDYKENEKTFIDLYLT